MDPIPPCGFGMVIPIALALCRCGKRCGIGNQQKNGAAAMFHETPWCEAFSPLRCDTEDHQRQALEWFVTLQPLPLTKELCEQIAANTVSC